MKITIQLDLDNDEDRYIHENLTMGQPMRWTLFELFFNMRKKMRWWIDGTAHNNCKTHEWINGANAAIDHLFDLINEEAETNKLNPDDLP